MSLKFSLLVTVISFYSLSAQVKKDTTFTVNSEFKKNSVKYPALKKIEAHQSNFVNVSNDLIYSHSSGRDLHLDAFINKSSKKLPAVIMIHGGGWKSGSKEMQHPLAQKIAEAGYQTFTVEYRLSDEAQYPASVDDVLEAIHFIKNNAKKFKINDSKIAVLGASSGAQMASLIGVKFPNEVSAVVNIDGLLAFHHKDSTEGKYASLWLGGSYDEKPAVWEEASALSHVSKKTPPFLFINSQFKRFGAGREDFIAKLDKFGIYSQSEKIENSPHAFWLFEPWFTPTSKFIIEFLNLNLKK